MTTGRQRFGAGAEHAAADYLEHGYAQPSRFLSEGVLAHFERLQARPESVVANEAPLERITTASIRASVRSLWESAAEA